MASTLMVNLIAAGSAIILLMGCTENQTYVPENLHKVPQVEVLNRLQNLEFTRADTLTYRSVDGAILTLDSLMKLDFDQYAQDFYENENREIQEIVLRIANQDDMVFKEEFKRIEAEGPDVEIVEVNCEDKVELLQKVFDRDQEMRRGSAAKNAMRVDHENLEIVVSFLEKCGMPTSSEVDELQMAGIWSVLQHAPLRYQKKYIPLIEEAAQKGDVKWSVVALMKDRALMHDGKPQLYGSQIANGRLYDLHEPEYVNQRRSEIGMEPIEEYLQRFDIEFDVEQKEK